MRMIQKQCYICNLTFSTSGLTKHLKVNHGMALSEYNALLGIAKEINKKNGKKKEPEKRVVTHAMPTGRLPDHYDNLTPRAAPSRHTVGAYGLGKRR